MSTPDATVGIMGDTSQSLPQASGVDGRGSNPARFGKYDEVYVVPLMPDMAVSPLEGTYFVACNAQTGLATAAAPTAFSATNPFLYIYNGDNPAYPLAKDLIIDYAALIATAAGTAGASVQAAIVTDQGNRYTSGGSDISANIVNVNGRFPSKSVAKVYGGNLTLAAASTLARTIVGQRALKGAIPVAGDNYVIKFGSVDAPILISTATLTWSSQPAPKVILPPNWGMSIHLWLPTQSAASSYIPEIGWIER